MKILVLKDDIISSFKLPKKIEGNLWITKFDKNDTEKNMISVEADKSGYWKLISNTEYYVVENSKKIDFTKISEYNFYSIKNANSDESFLLYCCPDFEDKEKYYNVTSNLSIGITIGNDSKNTIIYQCPYIRDSHAIVKVINKNIFIESKDGIYINNKKVSKSKLSFGDIVFIMGFEFTLLKIKEQYVFLMNNPNNLVSTTLKEEVVLFDENAEKFDEAKEEKEFELYKSSDYFYRKPRFIYSIKDYNLEIDSPPTKKDKDEMPAFVTIGPMLTMSLTSVVTCYTTINSVQSGNQTWKDAIPSLVISGVMILSLLLWPIITQALQSHIDKKKEKKRQSKYSKYIDEQKDLIIKEKSNQENILRKSYPNLTECVDIIINKRDRLWERRIYDDDFLSVSLGYGSLPLKIKIDYPKEHFSMDEDNLREKVKELGMSEKKLENVPIPFSLKENFVSALIGNKNNTYKMLQNIILQLITFHSYDDLKIVFLSTKDKILHFEDYKELPYCFSDDKNVRFYASDNDEIKEISYHLEKIYNQRKETQEKNNSEKIKFDSNFLVITDSFNSIRNFDFIKNIVENEKYLGFSLLILNDKISNLPDQCQTFIELNSDISKMFKNIANNEEQKFKVDFTYLDLKECFRILSNLPIELNNSKEGVIPKKVGFLEMYEIGKVEQFNSKIRWNENVPILNMGAIVGIGKNGEKISLDLHEKYHGPHGLIAGMTGSGKSEFIITYILSMAVNYHPYEVQFILIDYKGGGLAGAFENSALGYKLPHLVGVITNLDKSEINRSLASIESELKRRQALFNKARDISGESTVDIYKYQKMYRNHIVDEPVSHLFIIADEFAELKTQQPEFMEQLISTARIGRSLGVHLILATQKPSGVVDSQIWSNTRFRVCLRVQEKGDSTEVIQCPDAAFLTQTGRFYLQVGYNEIFVLGQSAWAGGKYIPSETIKKTIDSSVNFINNIGYITKSIETKKEEVVDTSKGEELINIVRYLCDCAKEENIVTKPLWLDKIPEFILVTDLIKKYNYQKEKYVLNPVIGEYDIPSMQKQELLTVPFSKEGNMILYGMAGSGKENFITSMIYSSMLTYTPNEINYYIVDFGSEVLRYFEKSPFVGDVLYISDTDKLENLLKLISDMINERKKLFVDYNGSYEYYCKESGKTIPNIVVVINNYDAFIDTYPDYYDVLVVLSRDCIKYGIFFMLTTTSSDSIRFKLNQNFGQQFVLQQTNEDDYSQILGNVHKTFPSKIFGRGIIKKENIYEFQTAYVSKKEDILETIRKTNELMTQKYGKVAKKVPILPEVVTYNEFKESINKNEIMIGIDKSTLKPVTVNFNNYLINTIQTLDLSLIENIINPLIYQFSKNINNLCIVINSADINISEELKTSTKYYDSNFDGVFDMLLKYLNDSVDLYENSKNDISIFSSRKKIKCIIIGPSEFKNKLSYDRQEKLEELFNKGNNLDLIKYIFIDTNDKLNNFNYDEWYKSKTSSTDTIWIGNGISDQYLITISNRLEEMRKDIPSNFGFVVKKGKAVYVKFVEEI